MFQDDPPPPSSPSPPKYLHLRLDTVESTSTAAEQNLDANTQDAALAVGVSKHAVESRVREIQLSGVMSSRRSGWVRVGRFAAPVVPSVVRSDGWINHAATLYKATEEGKRGDLHVARGDKEAPSAHEEVSDIGETAYYEGVDRKWTELSEFMGGNSRTRE